MSATNIPVGGGWTGIVVKVTKSFNPELSDMGIYQKQATQGLFTPEPKEVKMLHLARV